MMRMFRTLIAPFERALTPRGWIAAALLAGGMAFDYWKSNRYRSELNQARDARGDLVAGVGPRLAGTEGIPESVWRAVGEKGLTPPPPSGPGVMQQALALAGAYGPISGFFNAFKPGGGGQGVGLTPEGQPADYSSPASSAAPTAQFGGGADPAQQAQFGAADPAQQAEQQQTQQAAQPAFSPIDMLDLGM